MNRLNRFLLACGLLVGVFLPHAEAQTPCEPGCHTVERPVCKVVPDVKKVKKIVYRYKEEPFCVHRCGPCKCCAGPYTRRILVKTEIICEEPTTKCVPETVPCAVQRKAP